MAAEKDTLESLTSEAGETPKERAAFIRRNRALVKRLPPSDFIRSGGIVEAQTPAGQAVSAIIERRLTGKTSPDRVRPDLIQRTLGALQRVREAARRRASR